MMPETAIQERPEVQALAKQATDTVALAVSAVVEDQAGVEWATAVLGELAKQRKQVETLRLSFTAPLNESLKTINAFFKTLDGPLAHADLSLRNKVMAYRRAEQERIAAESARLQAERNAKEAAARAAIVNPATSIAEGQQALAVADAAAEALGTVPPPPAPTVKTAFGSSTARRDWDFEVITLSQVPVEYLLINGPAVREAIRRGVRDIPGIRIYQKETLVVKPS
jgi:hypothetical protein